MAKNGKKSNVFSKRGKEVIGMDCNCRLHSFNNLLQAEELRTWLLHSNKEQDGRKSVFLKYYLMASCFFFLSNHNQHQVMEGLIYIRTLLHVERDHLSLHKIRDKKSPHWT